MWDSKLILNTNNLLRMEFSESFYLYTTSLNHFQSEMGLQFSSYI